MTDDDFEKVDQDFASEFDFVDSHEGAAAAAAPTNMQPGMGGGEQPKGSPAIVSLMVIISVLGGGYFLYSHFFGKSAESTALTPPAPAPAKSATEANAPAAPNAMPGSANQLPTLPEHAGTTGAPTAAQPSLAPSAPPSPSKVAEGLAPKPSQDLTSTLAPTHPSSDKSFEQVQKEIQSAHPQVQQQPPAIPQEVRAALQNISEEMTVNVNNIRQLEGTISNMAITLDHLNKTISAMDNRVLSLTETVDGLSQDLANVKKIMVDQDLDLTLPGNVKSSNSSSRKQLQSISSTEPNYNVHAIIPGRAWLKSASGQIITVTEGDKVGDYGTVAVIDAANGLVRTSSGIIIR